MTGKELNKVQSVVKKSESATLTGAVKAWCGLFKSSKEINKVLEENGIKVDNAIVPSLVSLAKDKEGVIQICREILPCIDGTFCKYIEVERSYHDTTESLENKVMPDEDQAKKMIKGTFHKPFGYNNAIKYSENNAGYFIVYNNDRYKSVRMASRITSFTFSLIAKCVTYYLTHQKNER